MDNSCYIGNVYNAPVDLTTAVPVLVDQDGKLGTQGFDRNKVATPGRPYAHPGDTLDEFRKGLTKIDEQKTRITALESKIATQQETIKQQQKQTKDLAAQLKTQAVAIETLTARIKMSSASFTNR